MNWQSIERDGRIVHSRPLWGKEKLFYALAQNQRGLANFTTHVTVKLAGDALCEPSVFEERLKFACTFTAGIHPILLATVAPLGRSGQIICQIPSSWEEARRIIEARIKGIYTSQSSNSTDEFFNMTYANEMACLKSPLLCWTPLGEATYELALATPHCLLDARGAMMVLQDILKTIVSSLREKQPSRWNLLAHGSLDILSPPVCLVKAPADVSSEMYSRCLEKWRSDSGSKMIYGLTPRTRASYAEGVTRRVVHTFSQEETADLFRKSKSLGVTNNTTLQAALWLATVTVAPPSDEQYQTHQCSSMFTVDARGFLKPEWKNYVGVGLCDASVSCPLEIATNPDKRVALTNMMQKITEDMKLWRDSGAMLEVNETISEGAADRSATIAEKGIGLYNAFLANFGIMDSSMSRIQGTEGDPNFLEVQNVAVFSRVSEPQYFTRVWTFNGQYNIVVNYNNHYFDQIQMEEFLKSIVEVLRFMLTM